MKKDVEALDKAREVLLNNFDAILSGKDLKVCNAIISNANALSQDITTKVKVLKAEESNSKAIKKLGGK